MTKLVLRQGEALIGEYPLIKPVVTIGRKPDNDLRIDNLAVSGHHARVLRDAERFVIEDLGSTNGTFIDGKRIKEHPLADGMEIMIGKYSLRFIDEAMRSEGRDQATVFIAPNASPGRPRTAQRATHAQPAHREQASGGGRMALIVIGGIAVAIGVFGLVLWLAGLI
jgi:pSer/pThr/pTyr-binding forkhead associated (FHA) protein